MITNERQYAVTRAAIPRFERDLDEMERATRPADITPRLWEASKEALRDKIAELRAQLRHYEGLKAGEVREIEITSLLDIPEVLIAARVAAGLTQKQLAERLEVREQQVQQDEATRYAGASLGRLHTIAFALGVTLSGRVRLPSRGELPEIPSVEELLGSATEHAAGRHAR